MSVLVEVAGLGFGYRKKPVLSDITFEVKQCEWQYYSVRNYEPYFVEFKRV